jgi:hypothetical protein
VRRKKIARLVAIQGIQRFDAIARPLDGAAAAIALYLALELVSFAEDSGVEQEALAITEAHLSNRRLDTSMDRGGIRCVAAPKLVPHRPIRSGSTSGRVSKKLIASRISSICSSGIRRHLIPSLPPKSR